MFLGLKFSWSVSEESLKTDKTFFYSKVIKNNYKTENKLDEKQKPSKEEKSD